MSPYAKMVAADWLHERCLFSFPRTGDYEGKETFSVQLSGRAGEQHLCAEETPLGFWIAVGTPSCLHDAACEMGS